jgi:hypothetical protein
MATAAFREKVKDKTHEQLVEIYFQASLETTIQAAVKTGQHVPERRAVATDRFKQKVINKTRAEMIDLCFEACRKMKLDENSSEQTRKRKAPEPTDEGDGKDEKGVDANNATTSLSVRRELRDFLIPKARPDVPRLTVRFDAAIEPRLQSILIQCVSQAKVLLEQCRNFQTLKNWIKFPVIQFPQWEDHFEITWGDENEMAIYVHEVGPDCYTLGKCVAVIARANEQAAASSSSAS